MLMWRWVQLLSSYISELLISLPVEWDRDEAVDRSCYRQALDVGHRLAHQPAQHPCCNNEHTIFSHVMGSIICIALRILIDTEFLHTMYLFNVTWYGHKIFAFPIILSGNCFGIIFSRKSNVELESDPMRCHEMKCSASGIPTYIYLYILMLIIILFCDL